MEMVLIKQGSNEWEYMWAWLGNHPLNKDITEPSVSQNDGEAWQYLGSFRNIDGRVIHEFRHRYHPTSLIMEYIKVKASKDISNDDIEKVIPIK